jgi:DNA uptake protein ComE-like DNA-binding protein
MMRTSLGLIAALIGLLTVPALAQTPSPAAPATPVVPRPAAPSPAVAPRATPSIAATPATAGKRIDINSAPAAQLDALPGIGPVRAKAIVAGRPYADLSDLVKKKVLTQNVYDGIKDRIALANINTASAAEMERTLKGIGDVRSKAIVAARPYATPQDLVTKGVLPQGVYDGMKDLITY